MWFAIPISCEHEASVSSSCLKKQLPQTGGLHVRDLSSRSAGDCEPKPKVHSELVSGESFALGFADSLPPSCWVLMWPYPCACRKQQLCGVFSVFLRTPVLSDEDPNPGDLILAHLPPGVQIPSLWG